MTSIIEESKIARRTGMFGLWRNKKFIISLAVVMLIAGGVYFYNKNNKAENTTAAAAKEWTVRRDNIVVSVESTGKVVAKDGVSLGFSVTGDNLQVDEVYVKEGDQVVKGDKIASVKTDSLNLSLRTAYSSYQSALADYNSTMDGATDDEKAGAKDKITSAKMALDQAKASLLDVKRSGADSIYNAQQAVTDAKKNLDENQDVLTSQNVKDAYDDLIDNIKSVNISLETILNSSDKIIGVDDKFINDSFESSLGAKDVSSLSNAQGTYAAAKNELDKLNILALKLNSGSAYADIDEAAVQAGATLSSFENHLYDMKVMLDATITATGLTQTQLDSFISSVTGSRTSVNTKITDLNNKRSAVLDAKDGLDDYVTAYDKAKRTLASTEETAAHNTDNAAANITTKEMALSEAERDYNSLVAPLTETELASARSKLTNSSINLEKARIDVSKAVLTSPIDGVVAQLNYASGDIIVDDTKTVATIINNDTLYIEVNVEEADVSKLSVGQKAYATFSSLDDLKLEGQVSFISLTSQTSNGIVTYLVRVIFSKGENQIREGMTAALSFVSSEIDDVLVVPVNAVRNVNSKPSVELAATGVWTPVTTGFTDGKYVEVTSGLNEGDKILY